MAPGPSPGSALPGLARFVRVFAPFFRAQWPIVAGAVAALIAGTLLRILEPWPLKLVIDLLAGYGATEGRVPMPALAQLDPAVLVAAAALALILIAGLAALFGYLATLGFAPIPRQAFLDRLAALCHPRLPIALSAIDQARLQPAALLDAPCPS